MATVFKNAILVSMAATAAILAAEGVSRLVLSPVDFLLPDMQGHVELNHRIKPYSAGHDLLGFRNESVPEKVPIIAIGDSMTYGVAASHRDAWPRQLERLLNKPVYNMALGGYGPVHYQHLLAEFGLAMQPELVIIGLYFGNDLMDAYNLVYSNESWAHLRRQDSADGVAAEGLIDLPPEGKLFGDLRNWLARHSVIYRVVTQSPLANPVRRVEIANAHADVFRIDVPGGITFLTPGLRRAALDLADAKVQEGLDLTSQALAQIVDLCDSHDVRLLVLLIPTKERVYSDRVLRRGMDVADSSVQELVDFEDRVKAHIRALLESSDVPYVDLLEPLRAAAEVSVIFPEGDGHPNAVGYSIIASQVSNWINQKDSAP
ncbi:MAG: SGNH/GDSL hydrolase family protein [Pseudomonadales bacterium]|nr:SGNH/GDSL hydrolase family protein [Pseudomonadales bacterium]